MKSTIILSVCILYFGVAQCQNIDTSRPTSKEVIKNLVGGAWSKDSIDALLDNKMQALNVQGVALSIINDGQVVYSNLKGFADTGKRLVVTDKTIFEGASLSKPVFAYLVMKSVDNGILDLDKPLYEYLPNDQITSDDRYKKITARMILSHSSGLPNWREDSDEGRLTINFEPGSSFEYSGEGYQYLARVLAHIYETDDHGLEGIFQKLVAGPLEMRLTNFIRDDNMLEHKAKPHRAGIEIAGEALQNEFGSAYSIHTNAADFSKWIIAILERRGLSEKSYNELFKPQVTLPEDAYQRQQGITNWTLGFAEAHLPFGKLYAHGGNNPGYTSLFAVDLEKNWAFIIFTNEDQSDLPLQILLSLNTP